MTPLAGVLTRPQTISLFAIVALRRISGAALPVVLVIATAGVRGFAMAALVQGFRVAAITFTTPLRARLIDRFGRLRVIGPQTVIAAVSLSAFVAFSVDPRIPVVLVFIACAVFAVSAPAMDSVIRVEWKHIGRSPQEVKALHAADSIMEEAGFLIGPVLASVSMLLFNPAIALYVTAGLVILGTVVVFLPQDIRRALKHPPATKPQQASSPANTTRVSRMVRTLVGPIATVELQRIVLPLILMGTCLGVLGILIPMVATQAGDAAYAGFLFGAISLGGLIGAFSYGSIKTKATLARRHGALAILVGAPLLFVLFAGNVWILGALLIATGLAVTPLYINAYLMMDQDLPEWVIHEANTWVPVGNNVGYTIGILIAGAIANGGIPSLTICLSVVAGVTVVYGIARLVSGKGQQFSVSSMNTETEATQ